MKITRLIQGDRNHHFFGNKYEPENVIVIEQIISDFMRENPSVRVSYESLKGTDYFEALENAWSMAEATISLW